MHCTACAPRVHGPSRLLHYPLLGSASPQELPRLHGYVDETLALKPTLKDNLRKLTPAQFERVLHPVFEEDELTLVIVGAVLGGAVGWAQAWWDARSKRLDAESRGTPPPGLAP